MYHIWPFMTYCVQQSIHPAEFECDIRMELSSLLFLFPFFVWKAITCERNDDSFYVSNKSKPGCGNRFRADFPEKQSPLLLSKEKHIISLVDISEQSMAASFKASNLQSHVHILTHHMHIVTSCTATWLSLDKRNKKHCKNGWVNRLLWPSQGLYHNSQGGRQRAHMQCQRIFLCKLPDRLNVSERKDY